MSKHFIASLLFLSLTFSDVLAQEDSAETRNSSELFTPVSEQERADIISRNRLHYASHEYFAKPDKIGFFEFDIELLKSKNSDITISPFFGTSVTIRSLGVEKVSGSYGSLMTWRGEIVNPVTKVRYPIEFDIGDHSIDKSGNVRTPDPNRDVTLKALENESYSVLGESYARLDEKIVYSLNGNHLPIIGVGGKLAFHAFETKPDFILVYEMDRSKTLRLGDVMLDENGEDLARQDGIVPPWAAEQQRRLEAYETYMDEVKKSLQANSE